MIVAMLGGLTFNGSALPPGEQFVPRVADVFVGVATWDWEAPNGSPEDRGTLLMKIVRDWQGSGTDYGAFEFKGARGTATCQWFGSVGRGTIEYGAFTDIDDLACGGEHPGVIGTCNVSAWIGEEHDAVSGTTVSTTGVCLA